MSLTTHKPCYKIQVKRFENIGGVIMLKDIPYSELKEDRRAYDIMILRDQYNNTFADIAKEYGISLVRARELYSRIKVKQIRL